MRDGMRVIDVHTHIAPLRLAQAVRAVLLRDYGGPIDGPVDPDEVLAELRRSGADLIVTMPYAHTTGIAAGLNAHATTLAAANDDVVTFATVHPDDDDPLRILDAALQAGARGLKVHCPVQRVRPDDPRLRPILDHCERAAVPVLMHATHTPDRTTPYTDASAVATVLERNPSLRLCIAHLGAPDTDVILDLCDRHPTLMLDIAGLGDFLDPRVDVDPSRLLAHADRIIYGSDFPNCWVPPGAGIDALRHAGFSGAALVAALSTNAERFLGTDAFPN